MRISLLAAAFLLLAQLAPPISAARAADQPPAAIDLENTLYLDLDYGRVVIRMRPDWAPKHVARIKHLVRDGFYDGVVFHRVIDGFMAQTGDPAGNGSGGSGRMLDAEFTPTPQVRGVVSMARTSSKNSADSQWFIVLADSRQALDGKYTAWGQVVSGMEFVDKIKKGDARRDGRVTNPDHVVRVQVAADVDAPAAKSSPQAELAKTAEAAAAARDFSAIEFRCAALNDRPGSASEAALAKFWLQGYLAGSFKAQNKLTFSDAAAASGPDSGLDRGLKNVCKEFPEAFLLIAANQELAKGDFPLPATTPVFSPAQLTCKQYLAARNGGDAVTADFVDLWTFAYLQGYKNVGQPNMEIPFTARPPLLTAAAGACAKNVDMGLADLMSLLAVKVKLK